MQGYSDDRDSLKRCLVPLNELLSALAGDSRREILTILALEPHQDVTSLAAATSLAMSHVSHSLRELRRSGLVERSREGKWCFYSLTARIRAEHNTTMVHFVIKSSEGDLVELDVLLPRTVVTPS